MEFKLLQVEEEDQMMIKGKNQYDPFSTTTPSSSRSLEVPIIEKEHMFHKVVTPSDVGKLNRLVIPKQHAEKYFPLVDTGTNKGLLLNFEDRNGKSWRFRYSYWNSSQSYVITKGWSRFVKEKQLDAGDVVSFMRGCGESSSDGLFIDWRHRQPQPTNYDAIISSQKSVFNIINRGVSDPQQLRFDGSCLWPNPNMPKVNPNNGYGYGNYSMFYGGGGKVDDKRVVLESVQAEKKKKKKVEVKRLRLFGVNVDCPMLGESDQCAIILPSNEPIHDLHHYHQIPSSSKPPQISQ